MVMYYKVDAGSYGKDAGGDMEGLDSLFEFDDKNRDIHFRADAQRHIRYLQNEVEWKAGQKM